MKKRTPKESPPTLKRITVVMTDKQQEFLVHTAQTATDELGQRYSASAVLRALIAYAASQQTAWMRAGIWPRLEQEMFELKVKWGKANSERERGKD